MSGRTRHITMIFLAMLCLSSYAWASATGAVVITGAEQSTAGIWDIGTVTVTVNNYAVTVFYGQYSTVDSIASEIAAKFSNDCNGPANARSAAGGAILFQTRGSSALTQLSVTTSSNLSFTGSANTSIMPTTTTATIGSTVVASGQSTTVDVQVSCGSACGLVEYRIDGGAWETVALDGNGHYSAATGTSWTAGLHNVVVKFQGNGTFMPSTSNPVSFTITSGAGGPPTPIYSYNISSYAPNGNISAYTDLVNGSWSDIGYDGVNRLIAATTTPVGGSTEYQCWTYDSFGNRKSQTISATPCNVPSPPLPTTQAQYNAKNQITSTNLMPQGLSYDASGNVTDDGTNQYLYDAEGRICAVGYIPPTGGMLKTQYIYDAEGNRVAKGTISVWSCDTSSNGFTETSGYVLGPNGEQVTEVDGSGGWVHTNVYAAGQLIATYDPQGLHFHLTDWLGTRRVQTNYAGVPESTYQNRPFGEMVPQNQNLGATEHHFTGKERDTESGLDYFGARYYSSSMGRWMSPDWAHDIDPVPYAILSEPQSLNLYNYVGNNPLKNRDDDGHTNEGCTSSTSTDKDGTIHVTVSCPAIQPPPPTYRLAPMMSAFMFFGPRLALAGAGETSELCATGLGCVVPAALITTAAALTVANHLLSKKTPTSNPLTGTPGSTSQTAKPDGSPKQVRRYGPDGYPETDVDHEDHGGQGNPHAHDWGRPSDGSAPTGADRGHPGRPVQPSDPQPQ